MSMNILWDCDIQGHRRLVEVLAKVYSPDLARELDPMSEVLVTLGAYGSLFCAINGHVNAGDEVGWCLSVEIALVLGVV